MQLSFSLGEDLIYDILFENNRHCHFLLIVETGNFFFE